MGATNLVEQVFQCGVQGVREGGGAPCDIETELAQSKHLSPAIPTGGGGVKGHSCFIDTSLTPLVISTTSIITIVHTKPMTNA